MAKHKIPINTKTRAIAAGLLVGGFALWLYFRPYPWLGAILAVVFALFTYFVLTSHHQERYRRILTFCIFLFTLVGFIAIMGTNTNYLHGFALEHLEYIQYYYPQESAGGIDIPCNRLISQLFLGEISYLQGRATWQGILPTSLGALLIAFLPFIFIGIFFGRGFCAWICPFGGLNEALTTAKKERWSLNFLRVEKVTANGLHFSGLKPWVKDVKYAVLAAVILLSIVLGFPAVCALCPILWFSAWPAFWIIMALVMLFSIILPLMNRRRWWCQVCPFGSMLSLIDKISFFRVRIDKAKCIRCMKCAQECRMFALTSQAIEVKGAPDSDCIRCHQCAEVCPTGAIDTYWINTSKKVQGIFIPLSIIVVLVWLSWFVLIMVDKILLQGTFY